MKNFSLLVMVLWLAACALTPEQQAARQRAIEAQQRQLELMFAARCDRETARLIALQQQQWFGASAEDRAAYPARIADPVFQACMQLARENYLYQQRINEMEELELRREMRREMDWMMDEPFYRRPYGRRRW